MQKKDILFLSLAAALLAAHLIYTGPILTEDTFISLRYAHNLIRGYGLVFNPGEYVEGYTNFLWTMFLAGGMLLGHSGEKVAFAGTAAAGFAALALTYLLGRRRLGAPPLFAAAGAALLAVNGSFAAEAAAGLETLAFASFIIAGVYLALGEDERPRPGRFYWSSVALAAAAMTRPEGVLVFGVVSAFRLLWPGPATRGRRLGLALRIAIPFLAVYGPYYGWRFRYYGYPLPNTFYAKVGLSWHTVGRGAKYVGYFVVLFSPVLTFLPFAGLADRQRRRDYALVLTTAFGYLLYVIIVGGDYLGTHRFVIYVLPLIAAGAGGAAARVWQSFAGVRSLHWTAAAGFILVVVAAAVASFYAYYLSQGKVLRGTYEFVELKLPCIVLGALVITTLLWRWEFGPRALKTAAAASFFVLAVAGSAATLWWRPELQWEKDAWQYSKEMGLWLKATSAPGDVLVIGPAGMIPYYSDLVTYDTIGIVVPEIAHEEVAGMGTGVAGHEKGNGRILLGKNPRYVMFVGGLTDRRPLNVWDMKECAMSGHFTRLKSDVEMLSDPAFLNNYELKHRRVRENVWFNYFERRGFNAKPVPAS